MITYQGSRIGLTCTVYRVDRRKSLPLPERTDIKNHSPGFEWGYGGSGPAQLALALCIDATGDVERSLSIYQQLKFALVARLPRDYWKLTRAQVLYHIEAIERQLAA